LVKSPLRTRALPLMVKPLLLNVTVPELLSRSLMFVNRVTPPNTNTSPFKGALPPQLAPVLQLLFAPPPFQVKPDTGPKVLTAIKEMMLKVLPLARDKDV
jgi:hypothetical protein